MVVLRKETVAVVYIVLCNVITEIKNKIKTYILFCNLAIYCYCIRRILHNETGSWDILYA